MNDFSRQDVSGKLVDTVIGGLPDRVSNIEIVAYFKGARIALRFMQGVADERWEAMSAEIGDALDRLPGGDNPGHRDED